MPSRISRPPGQAPSASTVASSTASSPSVPPSGGGTVHDRVPVGRLPAAPRKIRDRTPNLSAKIRGTATHAGVLIFDVTIGASGEVTRVALDQADRLERAVARARGAVALGDFGVALRTDHS